MRPHDRIRWKPASLVALLLLLATAGLADDTDFFSTNVPPNVLLFVDESGSMRNIIQHPYFEAADAPFVMSDSSTCEVMTLSDSATNSFPDESSPTRTIKLVTGGTTGHRFEPKRSELSDWTATTSGLDDPDQGYAERTYCGQTRKIYTDVFMDTYTRTLWPKDYLDWYFHLEPSVVYNHPDPTSSETKTGAEIIAEIESPTNGRSFITGDYYPQYQISRMWAAKLVAKEVMYRTNTDCAPYTDCSATQDRVRFGIAVFRSGNHGGFVSAEPADYTTDRATLETAVDNLITRTSTPLGETLFQLYTYFMKRGESAGDDADRPAGLDGTAFPNYAYRLDGTHSSTPGDWAPDPIAWDCQKQFIIMITDGAPSHDQFTTSGSVTQRFDKFYEMVGDYAPDLVSEDDWNQSAPPWSIADPSKEEGTPPWPQSHNAGYLDDVAQFIRDHDLRGDIAGTQTVEVYTVGFTTIGAVNTLLLKTARNGNGEFLAARQADELADSVIDAISDIVERSQSFTSATIPASRASSGNNFFMAYFQPSTVYWAGHLKLFDFTANGEIRDKPTAAQIAANQPGDCAMEDPLAPTRCRVGRVMTELDGFWDAADEIPAPASRSLYMSKFESTPGTIGSLPPVFNDLTALDAADLGLVAGDEAAYGSAGLDISGISTVEDTADAVHKYVYGCEFSASGCTDRGDGRKLWDFFHSTPVVVGSPNRGIRLPSYRDFVKQYRHRKRVVYAGSNGGFAHGFDAGEYRTTATADFTDVPGFDRGTGTELMGFMAYPSRQRIAEIPKQHGLHMDGPPQVADVWLYENGTTQPGGHSSLLDWEEWRTVLVGGMREGGRVVWALDVTDPPDSANTDGQSTNIDYPEYLWEFPCEADDPLCNGSSLPGTLKYADYMGETWSEPVITRVKVHVSCTELDPADCDTYDRSVAIFGAGYDAQGDPNLVHDATGVDTSRFDSSLSSTTSRAGRAVFMVDVTSGEVLAMKRFDDLVADGETAMLYSVAASPAVFDLDRDGYADVVYIGDLGGNIWKWVISSPVTDPINDTGDITQPDWPFLKFFQAEHCTTGIPRFRSIYAAPTGALVGSTLWLTIGTGERQELDFIGTRDCEKNRFYVLKDADPLEIEPAAGRPYGDSTNLMNADSLSGACNAALPADKIGFYVEGVHGEKFITDTAIFFGKVLTGSYVPSGSTDACTAAGDAFLYGFDLFCGAGAFEEPDVNGDMQPTRFVHIGTGLPNEPRVSVGSPSSGGGGGGGGDDCEDMVMVITSDSEGFLDCPGGRPDSGIKLKSWSDR